MSPRKRYTELLINGDITLSQLPDNQMSAAVKRIKSELHMNQFDKEITLDANNPEDAKQLSHVHKMLNLLWTLGYDQKFTTIEAGQEYWIRIRQYPVNGTLAILGVSQKMKVYKKVRIMHIITPTDAEGNPLYTLPWCDCIYISGSKWTLGCTRGNPYAELSDTFNVWDEPFHGIR